MTKKDEKKMVSIAEGELEKFVKEWKKYPYLWETETDVHAELYKRIKSSIHKYKKFRRRKFKYTYEENGKTKEMPKKEWFDWIYLKPKTYIKGERSSYYPDIVIYKDTGNKHHVKDKENEPMLWVCEIKYSTEWSSMLSKVNVKNDIYKLQSLLEQKNDRIKGTDYACYLVLKRCKLEKSYDRKLKESVQINKNQSLRTEEKQRGKFKQYCYSIYYGK